MANKDVRSGSHFRKLKEIEPSHLANYANEFGVEESKIEEIFVWMQDKSREDLGDDELAQAAQEHFLPDDDSEEEEIEFNLFEELAIRARDKTE